MTSPRKCPKCSAELIDNVAEAQCPQCLLRQGMAGAGQTDASWPADLDEKVERLWEGTFTPDARPDMTIKLASSVCRQSFGLVIKPHCVTEVGSAPPHDPTADYELLNILGVGGMGIVYMARQTSIDRTIALKMIKPEVAETEEQQTKFLAEATITGELDHPNIVPIHELGADAEGRLFYAMKCVKGVSWKQAIGKRSLDENLDILLRVADAVAFAHSRGVIHRDLKPENVMLGDFGEVLLMDWGLAVAARDGQCKAEALTKANAAAGTPVYMAPEMAHGDIAKIGPASDIYLLGAILFEIVTGKRPHVANSTLACLLRAARNVIEEPGESGELVDIALTAMATEPGDRYGDVKAFQGVIREYRSHIASLGVSSRAAADLAGATRARDYDLYAQALFGFRQAVELWAENTAAKQGVVDAALAYGQCAFEKGDLDLAASLARDETPGHRQLAANVATARRVRNSRQQRLRLITRAVIGLAATIMIVLAGAFFWIRAEKERAVRAETDTRRALKQVREEKEKVVTAQEAETKQRRVAETARDEAEAARGREEEARVKAEEAKQTAENQRELAERRALALRRYLYGMQVPAVAEAIEKGNAAAAVRILESLCPGSGEQDMRDFLWYYYWRQCREGGHDLYGHRANINCVAFSPDGRFLASGSVDYSVKLWDVRRRKELATLRRHPHQVWSISFSPDGKSLAVAGGNIDRKPWGYLYLWQVPDGHKQAETTGVHVVAFSPDGTTIAAGALRDVKLLDAATLEEQATLGRHQRLVTSVVFSPAGRYLVTGSSHRLGSEIKVWDVGQRKLVTTLGAGSWVAYSPDGKTLATGERSQSLRLWDAPAWKLRKTVKVDGWLNWLAFSPDNTLLATAEQALDGPGHVVLRRASDGEVLNTLFGHRDRVLAVAFSPDGRLLASGARDKLVKLWDLGSGGTGGDDGVLCPGGSGSIAAVCLSPDAHRLVTAGANGVVKVWDTADWRQVAVLSGHKKDVNGAAFSPDGKTLATAGTDATVRLWNTHTWKEKTALKQRWCVTSVAFSADGACLAAGGDREIDLWDTAAGTALATFGPHDGAVRAVAFVPGSSLLASAGDDPAVKLWNTASRRLEKTLTGHSQRLTCLAASPHGEYLVSGSYDRTVRVWDPKSGEQLSMCRRFRRTPPRSVALSADGRLLAVGNAYGMCGIVEGGVGEISLFGMDDPRSPKDGAKLTGHTERVMALAFSRDRSMLVAGSMDGTVKVWDPETAELQASLPGHAVAVTSLAFSPDGRVLAVGIGDFTVKLFDVTTEQERGRLIGHSDIVTGVAFSPDGSRVASVSLDRTVKVWNPATAKEQATFGPHKYPARAVAFSRDGKLVASGDGSVNSKDSRVKLWDISSGKETATLGSELRMVRQLRFLPDDRTLVASTGYAWSNLGGRVRIWDITTGKEHPWLGGQKGPLFSLACSPDGTMIATGCVDKTVQVWDTNTGKKIVLLEGHEKAVSALTFSPDGRTLVSGSADKTIRFWAPESGQERGKFTWHKGMVTCLAFSPDGTILASGSEDGGLKLWRASRSGARPVAQPERRAGKPLTPKQLHAALKQANPVYTGAGKFKVRRGRIVEARLQNCGVAVLSPFRGLPLVLLDVAHNPVRELGALKSMRLKHLNLDSTEVKILDALAGMPLESLNLWKTGVSDLTALKNMPLKTLLLGHCKDLRDLSPLRELPLTRLGINGTQVHDISPLRGMALECLDMNDSRIDDISVLENMPIRELKIMNTAVADISVLAGMPLRVLWLVRTNVTDISVLQGAPLVELWLHETRIRDVSPLAGCEKLERLCMDRGCTGIEALRQLPSLKCIGYGAKQRRQPAAEFWRRQRPKP